MFSLVIFKTNYGGVFPIFAIVILVDLKEIGICCIIFLGFGASAVSGAAIATNLDQEKEKMVDFGQCYRKANTLEQL